MMSLLGDFEAECVKVAQAETSDGAGGQETTYTPETAVFTAHIAETPTAEARTAERPEAAAQYSILFSDGTELKFGDIINEVKSGKYYRLTSAPITAPRSSSLRLKSCMAERWELPT